MIVEIKMPKYGSMMKSGLIGEWIKKEGDIIKKGDELLEVETDKLVNKVESIADGKLIKIVAQTGETVPVGGVVGLIEENN